VNKYQFNT